MDAISIIPPKYERSEKLPQSDRAELLERAAQVIREVLDPMGIVTMCVNLDHSRKDGHTATIEIYTTADGWVRLVRACGHKVLPTVIVKEYVSELDAGAVRVRASLAWGGVFIKATWKK